MNWEEAEFRSAWLIAKDLEDLTEHRKVTSLLGRNAETRQRHNWSANTVYHEERWRGITI